MKVLKSRRVQETTKVDLRLDETILSLIGGDKAPVSKALMVVARLDDETAARLDRVTEIKIKSLDSPRGGSAGTGLSPDPSC
jgi:hypothetical protein